MDRRFLRSKPGLSQLMWVLWSYCSRCLVKEEKSQTHYIEGTRKLEPLVGYVVTSKVYVMMQKFYRMKVFGYDAAGSILRM